MKEFRLTFIVFPPIFPRTFRVRDSDCDLGACVGLGGGPEFIAGAGGWI